MTVTALALALMTITQALPPLPEPSAIDPLPYRVAPVITPVMARFVAGEILSGRCTIAPPADHHYVVRLDVAVLVAADGSVRAAVPHAIDCPTVEQYGAGLVTGFARGNLAVAQAAKADQWYRTTLSFDWTE